MKSARGNLRPGSNAALMERGIATIVGTLNSPSISRRVTAATSPPRLFGFTLNPIPGDARMGDHNGSPIRRHSHVGDPEPGDGEENWSREKLIKMDQKFRHAVERALRHEQNGN